MKKRRLEFLSFYDHTGIENHLTEMAKKGWMIERISNYYWTYRKIESQELHFTVAYFPKASDFDPVPSEGQQTLIDFCAETGWELACTWFQMQIFYNTAEDPIPLHTDPRLEVDTIHRACKANFLRGYKVLLMIGLIGTFFFVSSLISDMLRIIASPPDLVTGMCCLALLTLCAMELTVYHTWHRKAKKAAEHEIFLDTPSISAFQKTVLIFVGLCFVYWMVNLVFGRDPLMAWISVMVFAGIFGTTVLVNAVKQLLKKKQISSGANKFLTVISSFLIASVLMGTVISVGTYIAKNTPRDELTQALTEVPLKVEDLMTVDYNDYITEHGTDESLFLSRLQINQRHGFEDEASPEIPELKYKLYIVKEPAIYEFCERQITRMFTIPAAWVDDDGSSWGADKAYRLIMNDGTKTNSYVLCYSNLLVRIEFNWEPSLEQMQIVGGIFSNYSL